MNNLKVLYEDNHLIVVIKEVNELVCKDNTNDYTLDERVKDYIKVKYNKPGNVYLGVVHRLDRPVGGVMVFAKTSKASSRLSKMFKEHDIKKKYLAVVKGNIKNEAVLENYIARNGKKSYITDEKNGKYALLKYKVLKKIDDYNLLDIDLFTGRHHQIRVQFKEYGFPLYSDQLYGYKNNKPIALFSYYLSFTHPVTKNLLEFKYIPKHDIFSKFNIEELL